MPKVESKGTTTSTKVNAKSGEVTKATVKINSTKEVRSTKSYDEKYTWSSFLNIPTFMVLFFMVVLGGAVSHFVANKDIFVPRHETNQLGAISYKNDIPMHELNGLTLNEVFENGNMFENSQFTNIEYWTLSGNTFYENQKIRINAQGVNSGVYSQQIEIVAQHYYYQRYDLVELLAGTIYYGSSDLGNSFSIETGMFSNIKQNTGGTQLTQFRINRNVSDTNALIDNYYAIDLTLLGIDNLTVEQMDEYYQLYIDQQGETFEDFYYYIDMEDYEALGEKAFMGFTVMFDEGGIIDTLLSWTEVVQNTFLKLGDTLVKLYEFLSFRIDEDFDMDGQLERYGTEYEDIPRTKLEVLYRTLPKWMQPDTWFD